MSIKPCQRCFFCHSVVLCQSCNKCPSCCSKSTCWGQISKLLAGVAGSECQSKGYPNLERGLHPTIPDPTKAIKVSHSHKLLCQSPQEQLAVGGITSAFGPKRSRAGPKLNFTRVFQVAFSSAKTQQQMEAHTRPKQTESISQNREIQNGDTVNHQNVSPTRGVGHFLGFQGHLLPYTNTGTVPEISKISYPGSDIPIQSSTFRSVHSTHGVHCGGKGGETDGHKPRYKNPPVPRRRVGESQIPPGLSPVYSDPSGTLSKTRLAGEFRKVGIGTQTGLRLCRLPVPPQVRPGQTDSGPVAKPSGKNTSTLSSTGLSGPAVHVPDRPANSHRETSSPRPVTHETHTVASQKRLEVTRIFRKGYPSSEVLTYTFEMVARGKQCTPRSTITPNTTCSADIYRRIKRRLGRSLKRVHCKRILVGSGKQTAYKLSGAQSSFSSFKRVPKSLCWKNSSRSNRQYHGGSLHKQRRGHEVGPTVCPTLEDFDLVFLEVFPEVFPVTRKARHIPGHLNVIADKLSRLGQTIQTEWSLPEIFQKLCTKWHRPQIDLFATRFNHKLPQFVSPVPDSLAVAVDALTLK